jgi:hypothetical protein
VTSKESGKAEDKKIPSPKSPGIWQLRKVLERRFKAQISLAVVFNRGGTQLPDRLAYFSAQLSFVAGTCWRGYGSAKRAYASCQYPDRSQ